MNASPTGNSYMTYFESKSPSAIFHMTFCYLYVYVNKQNRAKSTIQREQR